MSPAQKNRGAIRHRMLVTTMPPVSGPMTTSGPTPRYTQTTITRPMALMSRLKLLQQNTFQNPVNFSGLNFAATDPASEILKIAIRMGTITSARILRVRLISALSTISLPPLYGIGTRSSASPNADGSKNFHMDFFIVSLSLHLF